MSTNPHTEQELARLLQTIEERERTARQRAFLYTLLPILVGIAFLSFTGWQVVNAERKVAGLKAQEGILKGEKDALEQSIVVLRGQVDTYAKTLNQVKTDVNQYGGAQLQKTVQQAAPITTKSNCKRQKPRYRAISIPTVLRSTTSSYGWKQAARRWLPLPPFATSSIIRRFRRS
jgi:hypothetical protein